MRHTEESSPVRGLAWRTWRIPVLVIVVLAIIGAAVADLVGSGRSTTYDATSVLRAQAESADESGGSSASSTLAVASAALVDRSDVVETATAMLQGGPGGQARARATARVAPGTSIVVVRSSGEDRDRAAAMSRAFALSIRKVQVTETRMRFAREARNLRASAAATARRAGSSRTTSTPDPTTGASRTRTTRTAGQIPAATVRQISALDNLAQNALPLAVVNVGRVSADRPSPTTGVLVLIGAVGGMLIGLVVVGFLTALRRRTRRIVDLPALRSGPVPVIGAVPPLRTYRGKDADAFTLSDDERELFRIVRRGVRDLADGEPQVVLITSAEPGAGKSSVAAGLAAVAAGAGQRVLLVECDLREPSQAERLGLAAGPGLSDYLSGRAEPRETVRRVRIGGGGGSDLFAVTAGTAGPTEAIDGARMDEMLGYLRDGYDLTVLDAPPLLGTADAAHLLDRSDVVAVCTRLGNVSWNGLEAAVDAASRGGDRHVGIVATEVDRARDPAGETRVYGARDKG